MENLNIPQLLKFDLERVLNFVEDAGKVFNQPLIIIEKEKKEVREKLLPELNLVLYGKGKDGLKNHLNRLLKGLDYYFDEWQSYKAERSAPDPKANKELFFGKFMMDTYKYIFEENCQLKEKQMMAVKREAVELTYEWQGSPEDIEELFQKIKGWLIADDNTEPDFKPIFEAKPIKEIKPVRWHDNNASELIYFIKSLGKFQHIKSSNRANYKQMTGCFIRPDGNPFNKKSFASLKHKLSYNLSKDKQKAIDRLMQEF